ncbi:hypothetical protein M9H77_31093 [Catharanthus roseus]|uniref:Uncharacterized protein n=1 Tax=Catharanthus roseus TaxID=4058 RepID=A0ACB9ZZG9_CATRO|nr:hypothetical protein M9H77_31093 [Catharanthus roseus]
MFPLYFHYEDVSRQDPFLKMNHANVMEVPGSCKGRELPEATPSIKKGKWALEILRGQQLIKTQRVSIEKSLRSNLGDLARQITLRGHVMSNFLVRISTVMSLLDSLVEIQENSIQFSMETVFCKFSPELKDHFEIFEHIQRFNVTIITSASTQNETLPLWSGSLSS